MRDRYTITERLDQGGMAEVFRGVAESLQGFKKSVAIKRILPSLTKNQKFVSMFLDEARLSLFLQHANIVQVFDISKTPDNAYFLVMEYVDGCNLKSLLERQKQRGKRIDVAHAIYLMIECCKALNYAHSLDHPETNEPLNIVHRDISPPNILLSKMGEVKLVDFGLAKANSQIESTDPGVVKGKFSYLSPEAASGLEVDHRADVFAVGIILWEMFTGRRLFYGDTDYATVEQVRQARVPSVAAINPEIEPELEGIVRKALARDPDERYPNAADLGDSLSQYLFSRRMKVTARDIAGLVRDTQMEMMRKRSAAPKESLIDALINDEVAKLTSLVDDAPGETPGGRPLAEGSQSLDPGEFINTEGWVTEFASDVPSSQIPRPEAVRQLAAQRAAQRHQRASQAPANRPPPRDRSDRARAASADDDVELSQMLEPDRTGVHRSAGGSSKTLILIVLLLVIGAGVAVGYLMFGIGKP
jgi:eukaryotic-like serine/threonine-protein kinase